MRIKLLGLFFLWQHTLLAMSNPQSLQDILKTLPEWEQQKHLVQIEKIETGLSNQNYKAIFPTQSYFVRIASSNASLLRSSCENEFISTKAASAMGIAPFVICYLPDQQAIIFPFINSKPMSKQPDSYKRLIRALTQFHDSNVALPTTFCPYETIQQYYLSAVELRASHHIPGDVQALKTVDEIRNAIPSFKKLVPCHLDLYHENCLDDGNRIWLVDWEYSAMADPLFDLATLASSEFMSLDEMKELINLYISDPQKKDLAYLYLMSILADTRWWLWCYIQAETSKVEADYLSFADWSFKNLLEKVAHPYYHQSLQIINDSITTK
jgi:thiamine kinase-like enzyme